MRISEEWTLDSEHISLELRPKTSETISSAYKWGKTVPNGGGAAWKLTSSNQIVKFIIQHSVDSNPFISFWMILTDCIFR